MSQNFDCYKRAAIVCRGVRAVWTEKGWMVDLKADGWHNTMEEALRFREIFEEQRI